MNRLFKFVFSKKLDKLISKEAERELIRPTYYQGKVEEVDNDVRDKLKQSQTIDKLIQNDDLKKSFPKILLSAGFAPFLSITLRNKVLVKDDINKKYTDKEYEANRLQSVQEQADFEQKQKMKK